MSVKGSLKAHSQWWNDNINNTYVLNIINNGYELPFISIPVNSTLNNNRSARDNPGFVIAEINKLLQSGVLLEVSSAPTVVNPLTVAISSVGKKRLVLDCRTVNPLLHVPHYKFEDIKAASSFFSKNCYMVNYDLRSGYHHIDIHPSYQQYLGLAWDSKYYVYTALAFGISSAGLVFTKVLKELVKRWRAQSIPVVLYLDDGIIIAKSDSLAEHYAHIVKLDLQQAGFIINEEKSCWSPRQRITWLGFILDSAQNIFEIPDSKIFRLQCAIFKNILCRDRCSARMLAKTVGKLTCLYHALGSVVYIMSKACQCWIASRDSWSNTCSLPENALVELRFWHANIGNTKRMPLEKPITKIAHIIFSDASATGCGAFIQHCEGTELVNYWTNEERLKSSTWRELRAVELFLKEKLSVLQGKCIKWYTDNKAVPRIIFKGSMVENLQHSALEIFEMCLLNNIDMSIDWIPRSINDQADQLSKEKDFDDWQVNDRIFIFLNKVAGPFTIDCFASNITAKLGRFYAKFCCSGVTGVDAFAFNWQNERVWLVPPPNLIIKTIGHCKICKSSGVIIIPKWKSAIFWPYVMHSDGLAEGISLLYEYKTPVDFFCRGPFGNSVFTEGKFTSNVLVLKLDFR
jgi:hypothetical protein